MPTSPAPAPAPSPTLSDHICSCGVALSLAEWRALYLDGYADSGVAGVSLELRTHDCKSTRAILVDAVTLVALPAHLVDLVELL